MSFVYRKPRNKGLRKRLRIALFPVASGGAAYTSTQDGAWGTAATWGGSGTPGNGDTASIGHNVNVASSVTVGDEPNDTTSYVVTVTSGGVLTIDDGVTLTVEGNVQLNGAGGSLTNNLTINGSGKLLFDGSPVSSSRVYVLRCEYRTAITLNGTDDSNRATIESDAGGGYWQFNFQGASPHLNDTSFGLIKRCGDASNLANPNLNYANEASQTISIIYTKFETCGTFTMKADLDSQSITLTDSEWIDSQATTNALTIEHTSAITGTVTTINRCVFDKRVFLTRSQYAKVNNSYFGDQCANSTTSATGFAATSGENLFVRPNGNTATWYGGINDVYLFANYLDSQNIAALTMRSRGSGDVIADCVSDWGETSPNNPDGFFITENSTGRDYSATGNIFLQDSAGTASGTWLNVYYATADGTIAIEHNTVCTNAAGQAGTYCGETGSGATGQITSHKSNIYWTPTGDANGDGYKIIRASGSTVQDIVSAANCDYNWGWNLAAGTEGDGYECKNTGTAFFSTGTPDSNGGNGDPQFVDSTRNLVRFDIDNLGNSAATAWADATAYSVGDEVSASDAGYFGGDTINWRCVTAHTSSDGDSTDGKPGDVSGFRTNWEPMSLYRLREDPTRIETLLDWVRAGFAVQNASLEDAGHDSVTIGAGVYVPSFSSAWSIGSNVILGGL